MPFIKPALYFIVSQGLGFFLPAFVKQFLDFDMEAYATDLAKRFDEGANAATIMDVHAWLFILISVCWVLYWLWPYRNVEIQWPHRKITKTPSEKPNRRERGLSGEAQEIPKYALPQEAEHFPIGSLSFQDLGDMMIKLSQEILTFVTHFQGRYNDHRIANEFFSTFIPRFFWLYEEAHKRGFRNSLFDRMYRNLRGEIFNGGHVRNVAIELERFGNDVRIGSY